MSRFSTLQDVYSDVEREMVSLMNQNRLGEGFVPTYLHPYENRASFTPPSTNAVQNLFGKLAEQSIVMGDGPVSAFLSPAGYVSRGFFTPGDAPLPLNEVDGTIIMGDKSLKNADELRGTDYFNAIVPDVRATLEVNGVQAVQFDDITSLEEAQERYNDIVRRVDLRQKIVRFNEFHPHMATTTGVLGFALEVATDPVNLATLGAGSLIKKGATSGTSLTLRQLSQRAGKVAGEEGLFKAGKEVFDVAQKEGIDLIPAFLKRPESSSRIGAHLTASMYAGGGVVGFDALAQYAEYRDRVDNLGIKDGFRYSYLRGGIAATLGLSLGNMGVLLSGGTPKAITKADVRQHAPTTLAARVYGNLARKQSVADDVRLNLLEHDVLDSAEMFAREAYSPEDFQIIMLELENLEFNEATGKFINTRTGVEMDAADLGVFVSNGPTSNELLLRMDGTLETTETSISFLTKEVGRLRSELRDMRAERGESPEVKRFVKKVGAAEQALRDAYDTFHFADEKGIANRMRPLVSDVPLKNVFHSKEEGLARAEALIANNIDDLPADSSGAIQKTTFSIFKWLATLGSQGTAARHYQKVETISSNGTAQVMARLFGAFDPRIANTHFADATGAAVSSVYDNIIKIATRRGRFTLLYDDVMKGKTPLEESQIGVEVMLLRQGVLERADVSEEARKLFEPFGKYYDDLGSQGVRNGALKRKEKDYISVALKSDLPNPTLKKIAALYSKDLLDRLYRTGENDDLHRGALFAAKVVDEKGNPIRKGVYDTPPVKRKDLTPEDQALYDAVLEDTILTYASKSISRRMGRMKSSPEDPVLRTQREEVLYNIDHRATRPIEQSFWISPEVLALDVVETNLKTNLAQYDRGMGAYIGRQETFTEIFGEPINPESVMEVLEHRIRAMDDTDPHKTLLLDAHTALKDLDRRTLGHVSRKATGIEHILTPAIDLAAAAIQMGIAIPMQNEVILTVLRSVFSDSDKKLFLKHGRELLDSGATKRDLVGFQYIYELEKNHLTASRYVGSDGIDPVGSVGKGVRWWKHKSRQWFGEDFLTSRMKRFTAATSFGTTSRKLYRIIDKLEKLDVEIPAGDAATFKAVAREAGFGSDVILAKDIRRLGIATPRMRRALAEYKRIDKEALYHPDQAAQVAMRVQDADLRSDMLDLADRLTVLAREHTDRIIVTRSPGTALRDNDVLGAMVFQFLTYPSSWFNALLKRQSQGPNTILAGYMTSYVLSEIFVSMLRDFTMNGKSAEEIATDWDENFWENIGVIASRVPIAGAFSDLALSGPISLATGSRARMGLSSNPAGSFFERMINEMSSTSRNVLTGEGADTEDFANMTRMFPVLGSPPAQAAIRRIE